MHKCPGLKYSTVCQESASKAQLKYSSTVNLTANITNFPLQFITANLTRKVNVNKLYAFYLAVMVLVGISYIAQYKNIGSSGFFVS